MSTAWQRLSATISKLSYRMIGMVVAFIVATILLIRNPDYVFEKIRSLRMGMTSDDYEEMKRHVEEDKGTHISFHIERKDGEPATTADVIEACAILITLLHKHAEDVDDNIEEDTLAHLAFGTEDVQAIGGIGTALAFLNEATDRAGDNTPDAGEVDNDVEDMIKNIMNDINNEAKKKKGK